MMHTVGLGTKRARALWLAVVMLGITGCSLDKLLKTDELPRDVNDPATTYTPEGAMKVYRGTITYFLKAFGGSGEAVYRSGILSDELQVYGGGAADLLSYPEGMSDSLAAPPFSALQQVRGQAGQAIGLLTDYVPGSEALVGHVYALEGYAEVLLAELYCSGIPLSTLDYNGDYTLQPGSSATEVFNHAIALFDTATALVGDSVRFRYLVDVGKGRALLNLGEYAAAAAVVAEVPDVFRFDLQYSPTSLNNTAISGKNFADLDDDGNRSFVSYTVANNEGGNGLDFVTSNDPRVPVTFYPAIDNTTPLQPAYYTASNLAHGSGPILLASGIEAQLIEAEAALQAGDAPTWLATLNKIRVTDGVTIPDSTIYDTLGFTFCTYKDICGDPPAIETNTLAAGQPQTGPHAPFPPAGFDSIISVDTTPATSGQKAYCWEVSYYTPCYNDGLLVVVQYLRPSYISALPGTGGVAGLDPLTDPGTLEGRVDLMFRERAFWLFLTGHRQGDLRRLIRQYGRSETAVFPTGAYAGYEGTGNLQAFYGSDVTLPVPTAERTANPLFTGCFSRAA